MTKRPTGDSATKHDKKPIEEVPTEDLLDSIRAELEYERQRKEREEAERKKKR